MPGSLAAFVTFLLFISILVVFGAAHLAAYFAARALAGSA
jgi:hypothetical protein